MVTNHEWAVGIAIFALTAAENAVATWASRADRQSTLAKTIRFSIVSANWTMTHDLLLLIDFWAIIAQGFWLIAIPTLLASWSSQLLVLERRRRRFRTKGLNRMKRVKRSKRGSSQSVPDAFPSQHGSNPGSGSVAAGVSERVVFAGNEDIGAHTASDDIHPSEPIPVVGD